MASSRKTNLPGAAASPTRIAGPGSLKPWHSSFAAITTIARGAFIREIASASCRWTVSARRAPPRAPVAEAPHVSEPWPGPVASTPNSLSVRADASIEMAPP